MRLPRSRPLGWLPMLAVTGLCLAAGRAWADDDGPAGPRIEIKSAEGEAAEKEQKGVLGQLLERVLVAAQSPDGYWIGVTVEPLDDAARAGKEVPASQGLIVESVVPESPAAKAGLERGDILLAGKDQPLSNREQLAKLIADVKEGELPLQLLRGKDRKSLIIRPAKRPGEGQVLVIAEAEEKEAEGKQPENPRILRLQPGSQPRPPHAPGTIHRPLPGQPGAMLPGAHQPPAAPLPPDMDITIKKHGGKPAKIIVKQGEKSWRTTENELDMLPPPARAFAMRALGHGPNPWQHGQTGPAARLGEAHRLRLTLDEKGTPTVKPEDGQSGAIQIEIREGDEQPARRIQWQELKRAQPAAPKPEERRLHELREQLERLTRELNELQKEKNR